ncbi:CAP domain-containing protein [Pseudalkalibacillus caeni]|uniref:SCP domain-containing protein n=1 Tax=Exobacillus caeni TaxID=2574798 RepID=A0A5R9F801_9BACL|nr:CAP domain-containing protein [Pseudalkalibacillus caeni]TLS36973.1 hypothetical protein FCL54_13555 [Pseudalkalibacillus caeni]
MKKYNKSLVVIMLSLSVLAACNTTDNQEATNNRANYNPMTFGPDNQRQLDNRNNRFVTPIIPNPEEQRETRYFERDRRNIPDQFYTQPPAPERELNREPQENIDMGNRMDKAQPAPKVNSEFKERVIQLTNQERQKNGLPALKPDLELTKVAQKKSEDMVANDYFSHNSPTYGSPFQMMKQFGVDYSKAAENIAAGQSSPEEVVKAWMNSPGHRKNILTKDLTHIGVGNAKDETQGIYWTQMFIRK